MARATKTSPTASAKKKSANAGGTSRAKSPQSKPANTSSSRKAAPPVGSEFKRSLSNLTDNEIKILRVFRKYLMSPGQVLCLSNTDVGSKKAGLQEMIADGLLVAESVRDGYSLTRRGYRAMLRLDS